MSPRYQKFIKELNAAKKILSEAYMFNDDDPMDEPMPNFSEEDEEMPEERPMHHPHHHHEEENEEMHDENLDDEDISKYDERISKIREVAIQGLQDYAENVNDARYQFFKKVFLECDKACQEKDGGNVK